MARGSRRVLSLFGWVCWQSCMWLSISRRLQPLYNSTVAMATLSATLLTIWRHSASQSTRRVKAKRRGGGAGRKRSSLRRRFESSAARRTSEHRGLLDGTGLRSSFLVHLLRSFAPSSRIAVAKSVWATDVRGAPSLPQRPSRWTLQPRRNGDRRRSRSSAGGAKTRVILHKRHAACPQASAEALNASVFGMCSVLVATSLRLSIPHCVSQLAINED